MHEVTWELNFINLDESYFVKLLMTFVCNHNKDSQLKKNGTLAHENTYFALLNLIFFIQLTGVI
jgi:hypothetical protein